MRSTRACLVEDGIELVELPNHHHSEDGKGEDKVDDALGNKCPEGFAEGDSVVLGEHSATRYLANARNKDVGSVGNVDGKDAVDSSRAIAYRLQREKPADAAKVMAEQNEDQRNEKPNHLCLFSEQSPHLVEIEVVVHIIEDASCN